MALIMLLVVFAILMFLGAPVAITMIGSSLVYILLEPSMNFSNVATKIVTSVTGTSLITLPLFIMAGEIMNSSGVTERLFRFPLTLIGHIRGGLAHVNVLASMLFAGMSGAAIADTAGLGKIEMDIMEKEGYDKGFSAGITAASSTIGPIIPPSNTLVVYAVAVEVSVGRLFMGGILPGVVMGLLLMLYIALVAKRKNLPKREKATWGERGVALCQAFFPMLTPVILLTGICTGIMTATEAGAICVLYALILNFIYNGFHLKQLQEILTNSFVTMAQICFIVMASGLFGWTITLANLPNMVAEFLYTLGTQRWMILLLINVLLLFMGCFLSINASLMIAAPILVVLAQMYDIDLVHLGIIVTLNLTIGLLTPPVGWNLYIMSSVANISYKDMVKASLPFVVVLFIVLMIITYCEPIVTWLPNLVFGVGVS